MGNGNESYEISGFSEVFIKPWELLGARTLRVSHRDTDHRAYDSNIFHYLK